VSKKNEKSIKYQRVREQGLDKLGFAPSRFWRSCEHYNTENEQNERKSLANSLCLGKMRFSLRLAYGLANGFFVTNNKTTKDYDNI